MKTPTNYPSANCPFPIGATGGNGPYAAELREEYQVEDIRTMDAPHQILIGGSGIWYQHRNEDIYGPMYETRGKEPTGRLWKPDAAAEAPAPSKRGRPATGTAKTATERKRIERNRWQDMRLDGTLDDVPITALLEWTGRAVKVGGTELVQMYAAELMRRAAAKTPVD